MFEKGILFCFFLLIFIDFSIADNQPKYRYYDFAYNSGYDFYEKNQGEVKVYEKSIINAYSSYEIKENCEGNNRCIDSDIISFIVPSCDNHSLTKDSWQGLGNEYSVVGEIKLKILNDAINTYLIVSKRKLSNEKDFLNIGSDIYEYNVVNSYYFSCERGLIAFGFTIPELLELGRLYWLVGEKGIAAE